MLPAAVVLVALAAPQESEADALYAEALARIAEGQSAAAMADLDGVLALDPGRAEAYRWRGHCHGLLGNYDIALEDYDRALELAPDDAWTHYAIGMARHNLGEHSLAIDGYTRALELDPTDVKALGWRGYTHQVAGDHERAVADLSRVLALAPEDPWAWFTRGVSFVAQRRFNAAWHDFVRAGEARRGERTYANAWAETDYGRAWEQRGWIELVYGNRAGALGSFRAAEERDPGGSVHRLVWTAWLARETGGDAQADASRLSEWLAAQPDGGWDARLGAFAAADAPDGRAVEGLLAAARDLEEVRASTGQPTDDLVLEARFYVARSVLGDGRLLDALAHLRACLALGPAPKWEWELARLDLAAVASELGLSPDPGFELVAAAPASASPAGPLGEVHVARGLAAAAGLRPGDRLLAVDDDPDPARAERRLVGARPGDALRLRVERGDGPARATLEVTVAVDAVGP